MGAFSVSSFSTDYTDWIRGFSFTPEVPGPDGVGSLGTAASVTLDSVVVGCPSSADAAAALTCYIYSVQLTSVDAIGNTSGLVGTSGQPNVGQVFGSSSYSASYAFSGVSLDPSQQYYVYFSDDKNTNLDSLAPYTGGTAYDTFLGDNGMSPQFQVNMAT